MKHTYMVNFYSDAWTTIWSPTETKLLQETYIVLSFYITYYQLILKELKTEPILDEILK